MAKYNLVNSSVLQRVFRIAVGNDAGSSFVIERKNKFYLVTAKHLFKSKSYPNNTTIKIDKHGQWEDIDNTIHYHSNKEIDIAVIETSYFDKMSFQKVSYISTKSIFSQDMFMLGFPYGLGSEFYNINRGFAIPYIKKGILSGKCGNCQMIDWDNNHGFSGGPVVYREFYVDEISDEMYIAGVISGYYPHKIEVIDNQNQKPIGYTNENSGIGVFYPVEFALEIIDSIS